MSDIARKLRIWLMLLMLVPTLSACKVELYSNLSEQEANEILAVLLSHGIDSEKTSSKNGVRVDVAKSDLARAIEILEANGLPRQKPASLGDVFQKSGLISSPLEERARLIYALSQELSGTLGQIDGVIAARVHVVLSEDQNDGVSSSPSSAAVFIKYRDSYDLDSYVPQIKRLVANSISGLTYDKVSVVLIPSEQQLATSSSATGLTSEILTIRMDSKSLPTFMIVMGSMSALFVAALAVSGFLYWRLHDSNRRKAATSDAA